MKPPHGTMLLSFYSFELPSIYGSIEDLLRLLIAPICLMHGSHHLTSLTCERHRSPLVLLRRAVPAAPSHFALLPIRGR